MRGQPGGVDEPLRGGVHDHLIGMREACRSASVPPPTTWKNSSGRAAAAVAM